MSPKARFLVLDDEREVCNFFSYLLKNKGYEVETAVTGKEALEKLELFQFNVALVDLKLPDSDGLSILKIIKEKQPQCEVIIITGYSTVKSAVEAIQLGAFDYVEKPFVDIEEMEALLEKALNVHAELEKLDGFQEEYGFVVGKSHKMLRLVAASQKIAKKNITVLIQGETGTGKEVLARYIHAVSHRNDRSFLAFNCGAFTETLLESELFGHEKGSFTGATSRKKGIFELAHNGTLFLDEIDSASPAIQIKLLRVLESGEFLRVGGEELCKVDVRIIAATNANLQARVESNQFREDLYYRLDVASLHIPPLRERTEDIPLFIDYFLEKEIKAKGGVTKRFNDEAQKIMLNYSWPGNIREVANTIAQAVLLSSGPIITVNDLPRRIREKQQSILDSDPDAETIPESEMMEEDAAAATLPGNSIPPEQVFAPNNFFAAHPKGENLVKLLAEFEKILINNLNFKSGVDFNDLQNDLKEWHDHIVKKTIAEALETTYGNQTKAASLLKITPRALRYYLKEK
ncbi:MAG: sigma-54-dependent Fis family transcriptional regulator [Firmicutes bacterium]|nr:sigma-54-dependent Fis family transcriptional regulator [Bacillota bacterium]